MVSPFPGMDPYLEDQALWPAFHHVLVASLHRVLLPAVKHRYHVVIKRRQYAVAASPDANRQEEEYIEVRETENDKLVTLLDVVSPTNKRTAAGRQAYLDVRRQARDGGANLIEIDLVLQGQPMLDYSREKLPHWDYAVTVSRPASPERYEIYTSTLQKRLPRFRLPLAGDDRDTVLDLQATFLGCCEQGDFASGIDYGRDPAVSLSEDDRRWLDALLTAQGLRLPMPPREEVAQAAYRIWEREGRPHGRDREHWLEAVEQLRRRT